jgi:hypothetical protein
MVQGTGLGPSKSLCSENERAARNRSQQFVCSIYVFGRALPAHNPLTYLYWSESARLDGTCAVLSLAH